MKKIKKSYSKRFKVFIIRYEDLEYIEATLKKLCPTDLKIMTLRYELASVDELKLLTQEPLKGIKFQMYNPDFVTIEIGDGLVRIYAADDDNITIKGALIDIENQLKDNWRSNLRGIGSLLLNLGSITIIACLLLVGKLIAENESYSSDKVIKIIMGGLTAIGTGFGIKYFTRFGIYYSDKEPNFFVRHKDNLIAGLIIAVISAILGALANKLMS